MALYHPKQAILKLFNHNGSGDRRLDAPVKVEFTADQVRITLENDIEIRPIRNNV